MGLEKVVDGLKAALDESRKQARGVANNLPSVDSPVSKPSSPLRVGEKTGGGEAVEKGRGSEGERSRSRSQDRGQSRKRKKHKRDRSHSTDRKEKREKKDKRERRRGEKQEQRPTIQ